MSIENINFQATWNHTNLHLQNPIPETTNKIKQVAKDIFSILIFPVGIAKFIGRKINHIANHMTLPAAHRISQEKLKTANEKFDAFWFGPITDENKRIRENFSMRKETVMTPDNVALNAIFMKHTKADTSTPSIIYFNGNFQLSVDTPLWALDAAIEADCICNFILFDYRGVGDSKGSFTNSNDLILDGSSIVQWVQNRIGTPSDKIHFYGFSLGGAISSLTKALDPTLLGKYINDRSFASSEKIIKAKFGKGISGKFFSWAFKKQGYSADPAAAFEKLKGKKLIIHHPEDTIIPSEAGLYNHVNHDDVLRLDPKPEFESESKKYHHIAPLHWHEGALEKVVQFLFDIPAHTAEVAS